VGGGLVQQVAVYLMNPQWPLVNGQRENRAGPTTLYS
jgi:hypothetical protein